MIGQSTSIREKKPADQKDILKYFFSDRGTLADYNSTTGPFLT
jgi:hypothetical protein